MYYHDIAKEVKTYLIKEKPNSTTDVTKAIKSFFIEKYEKNGAYKVHCSGKQRKEFMIDILVSNFEPLNILETNNIAINQKEFEVFLAIESELGGVSASNAYNVMKNALEDFLKLAIVNSTYKIMVFTSLPLANEVNHVSNRVGVFKDAYSKFSNNDIDILLIHFAGSQPRAKSKQVQVSVNDSSISAFVISSGGQSVTQVKI